MSAHALDFFLKNKNRNEIYKRIKLKRKGGKSKGKRGGKPK